MNTCYFCPRLSQCLAPGPSQLPEASPRAGTRVCSSARPLGAWPAPPHVRVDGGLCHRTAGPSFLFPSGHNGAKMGGGGVGGGLPGIFLLQLPAPPRRHGTGWVGPWSRPGSPLFRSPKRGQTEPGPHKARALWQKTGGVRPLGFSSDTITRTPPIVSQLSPTKSGNTHSTHASDGPGTAVGGRKLGAGRQWAARPSSRACAASV